MWRESWSHCSWLACCDQEAAEVQDSSYLQGAENLWELLSVLEQSFLGWSGTPGTGEPPERRAQSCCTPTLPKQDTFHVAPARCLDSAWVMLVPFPSSCLSGIGCRAYRPSSFFHFMWEMRLEEGSTCSLHFSVMFGMLVRRVAKWVMESDRFGSNSNWTAYSCVTRGRRLNSSGSWAFTLQSWDKSNNLTRIVIFIPPGIEHARLVDNTRSEIRWDDAFPPPSTLQGPTLAASVPGTSHWRDLT